MSDKNEEVFFIWEGLDKRTKKVTGDIAAPSEAAAKTALRKQGINHSIRIMWEVVSIFKPKPV